MSVKLDYFFNSNNAQKITDGLRMMGVNIWSLNITIKSLFAYSDEFKVLYLDWVVDYTIDIFSIYFSEYNQKEFARLFNSIPEELVTKMKHYELYKALADNQKISDELFNAHFDPTLVKRSGDVRYISFVIRGDAVLSDFGDSKKIARYLNLYKDTVPYASFNGWYVQKNRARNVYKCLFNSSERNNLLAFMIMNYEYFSSKEFDELYLGSAKNITMNVHRACVMNPDFVDSKKFKKVFGTVSVLKFRIYSEIWRKKDRPNFEAFKNYLDLFPKERIAIYCSGNNFMRYHDKDLLRRTFSKIDYMDICCYHRRFLPDQNIIILNNVGLIQGSRKLQIDDLSNYYTNEIYKKYILREKRSDIANFIVDRIISVVPHEIHKMGIPVTITNTKDLHNNYLVYHLSRHGLLNINIPLTDNNKILMYNVTGDVSMLADISNKNIKIQCSSDDIRKKLYGSEHYQINFCVYIHRLVHFDEFNRFSCVNGDKTVRWPNEEVVRFNYMEYPSAFRKNDDYTKIRDINLKTRLMEHITFRERLWESHSKISDVFVECIDEEYCDCGECPECRGEDYDGDGYYF